MHALAIIRGRAAPLLLACLLCELMTLAGTPALAAGSGSISGRVVLSTSPGQSLAVPQVAVYLEAIDASAEFPVPTTPASIDQRDARFVPNFIVVAAGQVVEMPNRDPFLHNTFSYSKPNDFDLGLYTQEEDKSVRFHEPGVVRIYCSIHSSMRAVVVVAPTPFFDTTSPTGRYRIDDVTPGRYRVRTYNEPLPSIVAEATIVAGKTSNVDLVIGGD